MSLMFKKLEILEDIVIKQAGPNVARCLELIHVLGLLLNVIEACFGEELRRGWQTDLDNFQEAYLALEENVPLKLHCIFEHVAPVCLKNGRGLAIDCEQAMESLHADFKTRWKHYKVKKSGSYKWATNLLKCVTEYNALNCI